MAKGSGKQVIAWRCEHDADPPREFKSSTFELEWPPKSGKKQTFPEINELKFFLITEAKNLVSEYLLPFFARLELEA